MLDRIPDMDGNASVPPMEESDDRHPWAAALAALAAGAAMSPPVTDFDRFVIVVVAALTWALSTCWQADAADAGAGAKSRTRLARKKIERVWIK